MPTLPAEIVQLLSVFAVAFTAPTFARVVPLIVGTILAPGRRTVASALRMVGLADDEHFTNYHRVLNRNRWSPWILSKLLLALIIQVFLSANLPIILLVDDTLERRKGKKIRYKGWFHDAILSTAHRVVTSLGLRWICLAILVPVPWSKRPWALPFLTLLSLSPRTSEKPGKHHRTLVEWAAVLIEKVRRWQPEREIIVVGDGGYAAVELVNHCQGLSRPVCLVSRLRLEAVLHDFPGPQPPGKRGPKPKKGPRLPGLARYLSDPDTKWETTELTWYGGYKQEVEFVSGVCRRYHRGLAPAPIRRVLVRCPENTFRPSAFFCSDRDRSPRQILNWFIARWNIEVT
ncbi:MAG: transposase, partial [Chloroflexi bacterium]|nr:transposase [Chloroflexota bacterium]